MTPSMTRAIMSTPLHPPPTLLDLLTRPNTMLVHQGYDLFRKTHAPLHCAQIQQDGANLPHGFTRWAYPRGLSGSGGGERGGASVVATYT